MQIEWQPRVGQVLGKPQVNTLGERSIWMALCPACFEAVKTLREFIKQDETYSWSNLGAISHKCFSDGGDQAIDGVISIEMDNTVGDDRKSSKTL